MVPVFGGGFSREDFGYNPDFDVPRAKELDVENLNPEPGILKEHQELFGDGGYFVKSYTLDALGVQPGGINLTESLRRMAWRHRNGIPLPSVKTLRSAYNEAWLPEKTV
jgi:hypothetical protein